MKGDGYSVWLIPSGNTYDRLKDIISSLSRKYGTPFFEPHVTLIGGLKGEEEAIAKASDLAKHIRPFSISLAGLHYETFRLPTDEYFKSLFMLAEKTTELVDANDKAQKMLGTTNKYMPHLSLLYGHISEEEKRKIIFELGNIEASFRVSSLCLFSTEGEVMNWYKVREFPLT